MRTYRGITRGSLLTPILGIPSYRLEKRDQGIHRTVRFHLVVNWRCEGIDTYSNSPLNYSSGYKGGCISGKVENGINDIIIVTTAVLEYALQGLASSIK